MEESILEIRIVDYITFLFEVKNGSQLDYLVYGQGYYKRKYTTSTFYPKGITLFDIKEDYYFECVPDYRIHQLKQLQEVLTSKFYLQEVLITVEGKKYHPYFYATPSGDYGPSSINFESDNPYINGTFNIIGGTMGVLGATAYIVGTEGIGAAAGGSLALTLSIGQVSVGISQIGEEIRGNKNSNLQKSSSITGYIAREVNSPYSGFIDAGSGVLTGSLQGPLLMGNSLNTIQSYKSLKSGKNVILNSYGIYSTGKGYVDFGKEVKQLNNK